MAEKKISELTAKGATIADTDLVIISESAGGGTYVSKRVTGANIKALVTDANMTTSDITTNNVSTSKHGFVPKAPNDTTQYLRGDGTFAVALASGATNYTEAQRDALVSPTVGTLIYNTTRDRHEYYDTYWGWHPVGLPQRDWGIEIIQEFDTTSTTAFLNSVPINSGTATTQSAFSTIRLSTATNSNGGYRFTTGLVNYEFGANPFRWETRTKVNTNSDGTDTFQYICGFFDIGNSTVNQVDGAFFLYDSQGVSSGSASSGNWQLVTASNNVRTFTTSSVAIDNTNFQKLRVDVNAAGTSVQFYIDDTLVGTHTTNIPTGASRQFGLGNYLQKSAGTTARTVDIDYVYMKMKFTTPR